MKRILYILILLLLGQTAMASNWSVNYSGGKFVISRNNSTGTETVYYRTVSISALDGVSYTGVNSSVTFGPGDTSKEVSVSEKSFANFPLRYRYQGTNILYYDFQVTDAAGSVLASMRKTISSGATNNNNYYLNNFADFVNPSGVTKFTYFHNGVAHDFGLHYHDSPYTPPTGDVETQGTLEGYVLIDDSYDYRYKSATVGPGYLFAVNRAGVSSAWHKLIGNKLYASVVFTEKEKDDGYAYVQVLIGDGNTAYDEGYDPDGEVNTPVKSIYKACFELKKGSGAYSGNGKWIFPHSYDYKQRSEETGMEDWTSFWMAESYLWQQKFRSNSFRAEEYNNAFILDPTIPSLTVRFDCGGKDNDTFGYKDLFVRWGLVDETAPTVIKDSIAVSSGLHIKGKDVTITLPFTEPVTFDIQNWYVLHTSWGDFLADEDCRGSNVVSFTGTITADAGTTLTIDSFEATNRPAFPGASIIPLEDLVGNDFGGNVSKTFSNIAVDGIYSISYNLAGGTVEGTNPSQYSNKSNSITLVNPTREHYSFTGWTGTGLDGPTMTVTIPTGSSGDRSYTATWAPATEGYWTGDGSEAHPYIITTPEGLDHLAVLVNAGDRFLDTWFQLGADIDMSGLNPFRGIGNYDNSKPFSGDFNGNGFTIRNLTIGITYKEYAAGLFHYIKGGHVCNLTVANATINSIKYMGVIAGQVNYDNGRYPQFVNCTVIDCALNGQSSPYNTMGAIAGDADRCTISGCVVQNCTFSSTDANVLYIGGLLGSAGSACTITNNVVANCTISGVGNNDTRKGAAIASLYGTTPSNLFVLNTTMDSGELFFGSMSYTGTPTGLHYHNVTCGDATPLSDVYTISASAGIVVSGTAAASYSGKNYYSPDTEITVTAAPGFTLGSVSYTPAGGSETAATDNGNGSWSFTMASGNVSVKSSEMQVPLTQGTKDNVRARWSTFYNGTTNHILSGATAYTMGTDHKLYRLGADGLTIPKGVAVVIIATSADVSIIPAGTADLGITDHAEGGNQLQGSDAAVTVSSLSGTPHVLSVSGGEIGFRPFTGASIPAGKAYYVVVTP
jgi:uncharacterized repeat protein (TIGR02543 family)